MARSRSSDPLPAGVFLAIAGFAALVIGAYTVWHNWDSKDWPTVTGKLTSAQVESYRTGSSRSKQTRYRVILEYTYDWEGKPYANRQFLEGYAKHAEAQEASRGWSARPLTVHVDPRDPTNSTLTPSAEGGAWVLVAMGPCFLGLGGWMIGKGVRRRRLLASAAA